MALTQAQIESVLADLAAGSSLDKACRRADISHATRFMEAVEKDAALAGDYARARSQGWAAMADQLQVIADDKESDPDANSRRLRVDTRKWLLSKMLPRQYGDKLELTHTDAATGAGMSTAELLAIASQGKGKP